MKFIVRITILMLTFFTACKKSETEPTEDKIVFTTSPNSSTSSLSSPFDTLTLKISISSKIPDLGIGVKILVKDADKKQTFIKDTTIKNNTLSVLTKNYELNKSYSIQVTLTSKSQATNTSTQEITFERKRVYKNYLRTSYELSNFDNWYSSDDLWDKGSLYKKDNPFNVIQTTQLDINGDGIEDVFTYESYPLNIPTPNPPPNIFLSNGSKLNKMEWEGESIKNPHGTKLLVGDFNNDSLPDVFSVVHVDQPFGAFPSMKDNCHLLFNSEKGFKKVLEFNDEGFWVAGCSGDIDKDGDLDIVMFNFHYSANGVKSKIQWNDGKGNFTPDVNGIGDISTVQSSELIDINGDGWLDLVIDYVQFKGGLRTPTVSIMWGNGKGFNLSNSDGWEYSGLKFMQDMDFADIDGDKKQEIFIIGNTGYANSYIEVYKTQDGGKTWEDKTSQYFINTSFGVFGRMIFKDIDKNGRLDIFAMNKKDNIRWEFDGSKFVRK